jgi:hypothetical protein
VGSHPWRYTIVYAGLRERQKSKSLGARVGLSLKSNAKLAAEFMASPDAVGFQAFQQMQADQNARDFLDGLSCGAALSDEMFRQLCWQIRRWLRTQDISKSERQIEHIAEVIARRAEKRISTD